MRRSFIILSSLLASACGPMIEEDVADRTEAINGAVTLESCDSDESEKLLAAMEHVKRELGPRGSFDHCVGDGVHAWTEDATPEAVVRTLRENMPTRIICVDSGSCSQDGVLGAGCADLDLPHERIMILSSHIARASIEQLAGTIVHEVTHNKGWTHPLPGQPRGPEYDFSVPHQTGTCIGSEFGEPGEPAFLSRDSLALEMEMPHVGGGGGIPFELSCGSCEFAQGFHVESSSSQVNRMAMHCDGGTTTRGAGTRNDSTSRPADEDKRCPPGDLVVGLWSGSGRGVDGLMMLCAHREDIAAGSQALSMWPPMLGGGFDSDEIIFRQCPPTMAVKRIYGRAGTQIDQLRIVCESLDAPPQGVPHSLPLVGEAIGDTTRMHCMGNGVLTALFGGESTEINTLGAACAPTAAGDEGGIEISSGAEYAHILPSIGANEGTAFYDFCPGWTSGEVLIGVRVRSGERVNSVQGICADATTWSRPSSYVERTLLPRHGGGGGTRSTLECPRGEFLVGMQTWATQSKELGTRTIFGLQPICRRIAYPRPGLNVNQCIPGEVDPDVRPPGKGDLADPGTGGLFDPGGRGGVSDPRLGDLRNVDLRDLVTEGVLDPRVRAPREFLSERAP